MATTDEAFVKRNLREFFKQHNIYYYMPATGGFGRSGAPDFFPVLRNGITWGIECKGRGRNKTTPLQRQELARIFEAGAGIAVVDRDNLDAFKQAFLLSTKPQDFRREQDKVED